MPKTPIKLNDQLRDLLKIARKERAHMSQRTAGRAAGYSAVWWRHIESGVQAVAPADTLARMCFVVGVPPENLDAIGFPSVAAEVRKRHELLVNMPLNPYADPVEAYLWAMPGTDAGTRRALIAHFRLLREVGGDPAAATVIRHMGDAR